MAEACASGEAIAKDARGVITLDTGALLALERGRDRIARAVRSAHGLERPIVVPAVVLAEWWRGRPTTRMAQWLRLLVIEPVDARIARTAGEALARVPAATTIDAIVMASAALRGGVVYTSDIGDLERLARHFPEVRVLHA